MDPHQDKNSFDSIIDQHFPKDIQQKRIKKELVSLNELDAEYFKVSLQNTAIGLKVIVELSNELIGMELENNRNVKLPAVFELLLDSQFPFNLPRLFTRTPIYEPSLADARDYLEDVMQRPWSPTILLKEVITQLPKFLKRVNELPRWEDSQSIGKYHPGELYSLEDLLGLESVNLFTGEEVLQVDGHTSPRYLGIVESSFLKFEPTEKTRNIVKLLLWTPIRSIVNVKTGNGDDRSLILTFIDKEKKSGFSQNKFLMTENRKFLKLIMDMGFKYNVGISRALRDNMDLSQYVAKQTPRNRREKIEELLQAITVFETKMETELNKDLIYGLMGLYQKVVEHFATHEDPLFEDFVGRLRNLMERQDIQAALRNEQQSPVNANKPSHGTDENQEEEEKQGQPIKAEYYSPEKQENHEEQEEEEEEDNFEGYQQREQEFIGGHDVHREQERVKAHHVYQPRDEEEMEYEQYQQKQEEVLGDEVENNREEEQQHQVVEEKGAEARDEEEREYEQYQQKEEEEFVGGQVENREEEEQQNVVEERGVEARDEEERAYEEYQKKESEELEHREEDENMFKVGQSEGNEERRDENENEGEKQEHNEVVNEPAYEENQEELIENKEVEERQEEDRKAESDNEQNEEHNQGEGEAEVKEEEGKAESDKEQNQGEEEAEVKEERAETEENMFKFEENNEQKEAEEQDQQKSQEEINQEEIVKELVEEANNEENNGEQQAEEHAEKGEEEPGEHKSEEEEGTHTIQEGGI